MKITLLSDPVTPVTSSAIVAESIRPVAIGDTPVLPIVATCAITNVEYPLSELTRVHDGRLVCAAEIADNWCECSVRGGWYPKGEMTETHDGDWICADERDENWFGCSVTGEWYPKSEAVEVHDGDLVCQSEIDDNWGECEATNEWYPDDELYSVYDRSGNSALVCQSILDADYRETRSGDYHHRRNVVFITSVGSENYYITRSEYDDSSCYFTCPTCDNIFHVDDGETVNGTMYCTDCAADIERDSDEDDDEDDEDDDEDAHRSVGRTSAAPRNTDQSNLIRGYSDRHYPAPLGEHPRKYGLEVEVEMAEGYYRADAADRVMKALTSDFVMLKEDGSLQRGFEIVTAPASFDEHRKRWPAMLNNDTVKKGILSWDSPRTGLHIHITRAELSQLQIGKMLVFANASGNKAFVDWVAGRGPGSYCTRALKKLGDAHPNRLGSACPSRYEAINTTRSETIEIRIFRGTINHDRLMSCLDFTDALVEFCAPTVSGLGSLDSPSEFIAFVKQSKKRWGYLYARLIADGYLPAPKKPKQPVTPAPSTVKI